MPLYVAVVPLLVLAITAVVVVIRARRKTRDARPKREPSGFVLLDDNAWDACTVDDLKEPWARLATEPIRGFCGVSAGRHRIQTRTASGEATLDFVIYPGEVLAWRLDAERARWAPVDLEQATRAELEGAPPSTTDLGSARPKLPGWLVHLRTTVNLVSSRASAPPAKADGDTVDRVRKRLTKLVARAGQEGENEDLLAGARALGDALVGRPLTRKELRAIVSPARDAANKLASHGDTDRAMRVVSLGLAVLPGDPELMVVAGCTLAARGEVDEAMRALEAALERDRCLEAEDVARAMRARLELRSRFGRSGRVRV